MLFSLESQFIAAVSHNGVPRLRMGQSKWQRLTGSTGGKSQPPIQVAFTRDSKRLVTPGTDHTIKI